jgi:hypothetical protein
VIFTNLMKHVYNLPVKYIDRLPFIYNLIIISRHHFKLDAYFVTKLFGQT